MHDARRVDSARPRRPARDPHLHRAHSVHYARLVTEGLVHAVDRLHDYPLSGRVVPELDQPTVREVIAGQYRIVYRVTADAVHRS